MLNILRDKIWDKKVGRGRGKREEAGGEKAAGKGWAAIKGEKGRDAGRGEDCKKRGGPLSEKKRQNQSRADAHQEKQRQQKLVSFSLSRRSQ